LRARGAGRRGAEAIVEQHALARHTIEGWGVDDPVAISTGVRPGPVVGEAIKNVRTGFGGPTPRTFAKMKKAATKRWLNMATGNTRFGQK